MNTAVALLEYSLLGEDEIKTLRTFSTLIRWGCFNNHEENYPSTAAGIKARIRQCSHRVSSLVISCPHTQMALLGEEWARDVLDRVILIFKKTNKKIYDLAIWYRDILRLFDFLRQAIEWTPYRLIQTTLQMYMLQWLLHDELIKSVYYLGDELSKATITLENKPNFLLRFQSLKNEFSTTLEPLVFGLLQEHSQTLLSLNNQSRVSSPLSSAE